jgi:hypothetical protein
MEYEKFTPSYRVDAAAPIQNKVGAFLADPMLDRMLSSPKRELRVRQVIDKGQMLIVNLAKGRIGDDSSSLLGGTNICNSCRQRLGTRCSATSARPSLSELEQWMHPT